MRQSVSNDVFLVSTEFVNKFSEIVGENLQVLFTFDGKQFCYYFIS